MSRIPRFIDFLSHAIYQDFLLLPNRFFTIKNSLEILQTGTTAADWKLKRKMTIREKEE
jgi:hypothetical protein